MDTSHEKDEKTLERPLPAEPPTEELGCAQGQAARDDADAHARPHLSDVTGITGSYLRASFADFLAACKRHRGGCLVFGAILVACVFILASAVLNARNVPGADFVEKDAWTRLGAPEYAPGVFGSQDNLYMSEVKVDSQRRVVRTNDSSQAQFGASGYAEAHVTAKFGNGSVVATKTATLSYAKVGSTWQGIGGEADASVSYEAVAGVPRTQVLANLDDLLAEGERSLKAATKTAGGSTGGAGLTLAQIYDGAKVSVESEDFDGEAQTETVSLTCVKASSFESYTCRLTTHFAFRPVNGVWEVESVEVNDDAKTRTFQPLVGTWEGTFQSQETDGAKCLGAGASPLSVTFEAAETADGDAGARLTGSISALAHFHEHPSADSAACDGDEALADVRLVANYYGGHNADVDSDLAFVAALPEEVGGTVTVTFGFGVGGDPTQAVARVQTTYPHKGTFLFIPYDQTITYTDVYLLRKVS
ncbi:hypothetical protein [Paratractidigestivibacter faecalis]|uniref:hypothetical protein n=1 Tax=Paratractidigestivibacter faecalis TaxID=2292441 RepID=UPI003A9238CC